MLIHDNLYYSEPAMLAGYCRPLFCDWLDYGEITEVATIYFDDVTNYNHTQALIKRDGYKGAKLELDKVQCLHPNAVSLNSHVVPFWIIFSD